MNHKPPSSFVALLCFSVSTTLIICLFNPLLASAQTASLRFVHLNTTDGLSHDIVRCIVQDHFGFIWLGTQGGLNRYDGNSFLTFHHLRSQPDSLSSDTINSLYEDSYGQLWVGTVLGLNRLAPDRHSFVHYGEIYESVQTIYEDSHGNLWIGTAGSGLFRYDRINGVFLQYLSNPTNEGSISDNNINALAEDSQGFLWIGTEHGGLNRYDRQTDRFIAFQHSSNDPFSLAEGRVTALLVDPGGVLWTATGFLQVENQGGVVTYNPQQKRFFPQNLSLSNLSVSALVMDHQGLLWIGSRNGLLSYDPLTHQASHYQYNPIDPYSLSDNKINALFVDDSGILWIATDGGGINKYAPAKDRFQLYQANPNNPNSVKKAPIGAILKDHRGTLWIGYHNNGLDRFDRKTGTIQHYTHDENNPNSLNHDHVTALLEDYDHNLWIGTARGLDLFNPIEGTFTHYFYNESNPRSIAAGAVKVILEDDAHQLWIGTEEPGTLNHFDPTTGLFTRFIHESDLPTSMIATYGIRAILQDQQGNFWLGTYNGLLYFDPHSSIFTPYRHDPANPYSLSDDFVWSLYPGTDETIWIGTNNGLNAFDSSSKEFSAYTVEDGLPDDSIVSILGDERGNLWLGTMGGGITVFNPQYKTFKNFDISDGLQSNAFIIGSAFRSLDGELLFGGINGFNAFYPADIHENPHIPALAFTTFRRYDQFISFEKDLNDMEGIQLSYKDAFFAFEFAALDYTDPSKNQYAYRMEGFDQDWIASGNRNYASYTNLSPGEYIFRVKGSNNDGVWNNQGIAMKILIPPPFWQTWWFRLLVIAAFSGSIFAVVRTRIKQVAAIRLSEERFRSLFENAPLGVCELDTSQLPARLVHVNPKWENMFLREFPLVEGSNFMDLFPLVEHSKIQLELRGIPEGQNASFETKGLRSDGSEFPVRISAARVHKESAHCILAIEDITIEKERRSEEEAIIEERRRIAQEIHDGLAQDLAALRLQTHHWQMLIESNPVKLKAELEWLHDMLGEKIREVRSVIFALRPVELDELGFWKALERFIAEFEEHNQLKIQLQVNGDRQNMPPTLEPLIFRIVQEVLHNVARHAQAQTVWITLDLSQGITLNVRDDGVGFDSTHLDQLAREGHLGLQQMRERVEALGGSLEVNSIPGAGTVIIVKLVYPKNKFL